MHFLQLETLLVILGATLRICSINAIYIQRFQFYTQQDGASIVCTVWNIL